MQTIAHIFLPLVNPMITKNKTNVMLTLVKILFNIIDSFKPKLNAAENKIYLASLKFILHFEIQVGIYLLKKTWLFCLPYQQKSCKSKKRIRRNTAKNRARRFHTFFLIPFRWYDLKMYHRGKHLGLLPHQLYLFNVNYISQI